MIDVDVCTLWILENNGTENLTKDLQLEFMRSCIGPQRYVKFTRYS